MIEYEIPAPGIYGQWPFGVPVMPQMPINYAGMIPQVPVVPPVIAPPPKRTRARPAKKPAAANAATPRATPTRKKKRV